MDPDTCLEELIEAMEMNEADVVIARTESLQSWMRKGGFSPKVTYPQLDFLLGFIADAYHDKATR